LNFFVFYGVKACQSFYVMHGFGGMKFYAICCHDLWHFYFHTSKGTHSLFKILVCGAYWHTVPIAQHLSRRNEAALKAAE
jgi:hypothetical protein